MSDLVYYFPYIEVGVIIFSVVIVIILIGYTFYRSSVSNRRDIGVLTDNTTGLTTVPIMGLNTVVPTVPGTQQQIQAFSTTELVTDSSPQTILQRTPVLPQDATYKRPKGTINLRNLYENYIVKKSKKDTIISFPCTKFKTDKTVDKVELFASTLFREDATINIAIYGIITTTKDLKFISDINFHERKNLQGVIMDGSKRYVTIHVDPFFDSKENKIKSLITIHIQCEDEILKLKENDEFFIITSYKINNQVMTACGGSIDNDHKSYLNVIESTYFCR